MDAINEIKKINDEYENKKIDKLTFLKELVKLFNITLGDSDLSNYDIKSFDFSKLSLEIVNTKDNSLYTANYSSLANYFGDDFYTHSIQLIKTTYTANNRMIENLYKISDRELVLSKITFKNGEYGLIIEKERPNWFKGVSDGYKTTVKYTQNMDWRETKVQQILLCNKYETNYLNEKKDNYFEKKYTYGTFGTRRYFNSDDHYDKYLYNKNNCINYGIIDLKLPSLCKFLRGICIENYKEFNYKMFPSSMTASDYRVLCQGHFNSAIIFECRTEDDVWHFLEIYKSDTIKIKYRSYQNISTSTFKEIDNNKYTIPISCEGIITIEEVNKIINFLESNIVNQQLVTVITNELSTFKNKLARNEDNVLDPLSPKLLMNKTMAEINEEIGANIDAYFSLIDEQFRKTTRNIEITKDKENNGRKRI